MLRGWRYVIPSTVRVEAKGLAGAFVGDVSAAPRCTTCGAYFFAETPVVGYAYRFTDEQKLSLARLYCDECNRDPLAHPTLGAHEVVIKANLRQQRGALFLDDLAVVDYIGPTSGAGC